MARAELSTRPYPTTPDRTFYYPATGHEAALARIHQAVNDDEGFAILTGLPGTGKTLLCHCLLDRLGDEADCAFLSHGYFADRLGLLQAILYDYSLPYEDGSEQVLRLRLTEHLLKNCAAGRRNVVLVDEAHHLTVDQLEELRLLGNLEAGRGKAFQVVLVGDPKLLETLKRPGLAALNQRLVVRAHLEPMGIEESADYLLHQVRVAGTKPEESWEEPALEIVARGARGVPRLLNQAARQALALARQAEMTRVDAEAALEALASLGLASDEPATQAEIEPAKKPAPVLDLESDATTNESETMCRLFESPRSA